MVVELTNESAPISFGVSGIDEIAQNVRMILNTRKGSVPLDRDFGLSWSVVDLPNTRFLQKLKMEVVQQVEKYEPRVKVREVSIYPDELVLDGVCKIKLKIEVISL
ncbi:hypothetical protein FHQ18_11690 [Deferribacter autotrophicus]|uniref:IraD/Gp25-like domain-containing protein n=1 Tax=Deferribacter autotrophicus TaxID=500465 RepID=A0A5A8EZW1_9BACT|nr:GPW/gp25 family protein [Deferribacter autotrophicus]KAA0257220.1 hypothetical protein FHQ18_11690 [Deferribacter autotrophicus]